MNDKHQQVDGRGEHEQGWAKGSRAGVGMGAAAAVNKYIIMINDHIK